MLIGAIFRLVLIVGIVGKLLDVGSRLQTYFCARFFRKEELIIKSKKGAIILVGGGDGHINTAYSTACTLLHHMNCSDYSHEQARGVLTTKFSL